MHLKFFRALLAPEDGGGSAPTSAPAEAPASPAAEPAPAAPAPGTQPPPADNPAQPPAADTPPADQPKDEADPAKDGADQQPAELQPFTLPDDMPVNEAGLTKFTERAKALGYSQEQAQGALDLYVEMQREHADSWHRTKTGWRDEMVADKHLAGGDIDKLKANLVRAQGVIAQLVPDATAPEMVGTDGKPVPGGGLIKMLNDSGLGDYPPMIRLLVRAADAIGEDKAMHGQPGIKDEALSTEAYLDGVFAKSRGK